MRGDEAAKDRLPRHVREIVWQRGTETIFVDCWSKFVIKNFRISYLIKIAGELLYLMIILNSVDEGRANKFLNCEALPAGIDSVHVEGLQCVKFNSSLTFLKQNDFRDKFGDHVPGDGLLLGRVCGCLQPGQQRPAGSLHGRDISRSSSQKVLQRKIHRGNDVKI